MREPARGADSRLADAAWNRLGIQWGESGIRKQSVEDFERFPRVFTAFDGLDMQARDLRRVDEEIVEMFGSDRLQERRTASR